MAGDLFDLLRILTVVVGFLDIGLCLAVFQLYGRAARMTGSHPSAFNQLTKTLPRHIMLVSMAHMLMILAICFVIIGRLGDGLHVWPTPVALVAFVSSMFGLHQMLRWQHGRINLQRGTIMVTGETVGNDR